MPLLRKKLFEKEKFPDFLRDNEEVFYCDITNEIFKDYQDFSERMFLCNSMVWTCAMTGKSCLTYLEAAESEENARNSLKEFPNELKIPILFLAMNTKRTSFGEMAEDIFQFAKDRYFIGENIEACFNGGGTWKDCHILSVMAPSERDPLGPELDRLQLPASSLYKYEIEHLDGDDAQCSEIMLADNTLMRRKKTQFSKDKCKLFLKQYVEQDARGLFAIRQQVLEQFGVVKTKWDQLYDGPLPNFEASKRLDSGKKSKQATLNKFLQRSNGQGSSPTQNGVTKDTPPKRNNLLEQMRKREEQFKEKRILSENERKELKLKQKRESNLLLQREKDWWRPKEDLELEDQTKLPVPIPVKTKVPLEHFGDILMLMEFVFTFSKLLSPKVFFPSGLTYDVFERALLQNELAGPLTDIIQMFLTAIFKMQEEEASQYSIEISKEKIEEDSLTNSLDIKNSVNLATKAATWANQHQGVALKRLPLYTLTTSEILRLHLLGSGARINETGARYRYSDRGGYINDEDPGLHLRISRPDIIQDLSHHNVVELAIEQKLRIISCLMDQLLTYSNFRDIIEERMENVQQAKMDLKLAKTVDRKQKNTFLANNFKFKKELKGDPEALKAKLEKLASEDVVQKAKNGKVIDKLLKDCNKDQIIIGEDRAYRKYVRIRSIPGIFINWCNEFPMECNNQVTKQCPYLIAGNRKSLLAYIKSLHMSTAADSVSTTESPVVATQLNGSITAESDNNNELDVNTSELLMCSADPATCIVHSTTVERPLWSFFSKQEEITELIASLNKRGIREGDLKELLQSELDEILMVVSKTPVTQLNTDIKLEHSEEDHNTRNGKKAKPRYEDVNLGYPPDMKTEDVMHNILVDNILEMEEKIYAGNLGGLKLKDREGWRNTLQNKQYEEFATLVKDDKFLRSRMNGGAINYDSARCLNGVKKESEDNESASDAIRNLAVALAQVAQSVDAKYLKKPLGGSSAAPKTKEAQNILEKWEQSLLSSTSFSQIFLHYSTLDNCIMWSRSVLLAKCRICRSKKDSENMILCDMCNFGYHLYCLKPTLTAVPKGDWFCPKCILIKEKEEKLAQPATPPPRKRRRLFVEEDDVEEEEVEEHAEEQDSVIEEQSDEELSDVDISGGEEDKEEEYETCSVCSSAGNVFSCDKCASVYHKECCVPPLKRVPRAPWTCSGCKRKSSSKRSSQRNSTENLSSIQQPAVHVYSQRRCAAKAKHKIHSYVKTLRVRIRDSDDENADDDSDDDTSESNDDSDELLKRQSRREECRDDLPLHNADLQELLADVMKHSDAWPFLRPVGKHEVPDYHEIIKTPMDFGTIKYKLNMGEYREDKQLMDDVLLVFENCNTYNHCGDEVYKCGENVLEHFRKKAKELNLALPTDLDEDDDTEPSLKKQRIT